MNLFLILKTNGWLNLKEHTRLLWLLKTLQHSGKVNKMSKISTILARGLRVTLGFVTRKQSRVQPAPPSAWVAPALWHQRKSLLHGQHRLRLSERQPGILVPQSPQTRILKSPLSPGLSKSSRERRYREHIARASGSAENRILPGCLSRKCGDLQSPFTPKVAFRDEAKLWVNCEVCSRGCEGSVCSAQHS